MESDKNGAIRLRLVFVILGLILLVVGAYFAYSPSTLKQVSNDLGFSTTQNNVDRTVLVSVSPDNYSSFPVTLSSQETMRATLTSNPRGTDVLIMDQGNYTDFVTRNGSFVGIDPASLVNVSTYTLVFKPTSADGNYYLVFRNPQTSGTTDVLVHLVVSSPTLSSSYSSAIPIIAALVGLLFVAIGVLSRRKTSPNVKAKSISKGEPVCRYCSTTMKQGEMFCPSCKKSQV